MADDTKLNTLNLPPAKRGIPMKDGVPIWRLPGAGRAVGIKNDKPTKPSIKKAFSEVPYETYVQCIKDGLAAKNLKTRAVYLKMALEYVDGKPPDHVHIKDDRYNEEEMAAAREQLSAKFERMFETLLARDGSIEPTVQVVVEQSKEVTHEERTVGREEATGSGGGGVH